MLGFTPKFLKWTLLALILDIPIVTDGDVIKIQNPMANSVDPDGTARVSS